MIAVFFPQHCARIPYEERLNSKRTNSCFKESLIYKNRLDRRWCDGRMDTTPCATYIVSTYGKKKLCSAYIGLFCGALTSLAGAGTFFFSTVALRFNLRDRFYPQGRIDRLGLAPYLAANPLGPVRRFFFTALMIVGMLLALVGVDGRAQSLALNAFLLGFFLV
jgi:hypothetical protein